MATAAILFMEAIPNLRGTTECRAMFEALGMEPGGRLITGFLEITAALLLILPGSAGYGAVLASGLMAGAIIAHVTELGFHGHHFAMIIEAVVVLLCCIIILYLRRHEIPIIKYMLGKNS